MPVNAILLRPARPGDAKAIAGLLITTRQHFLPYAPLAHDATEMQRWVQDDLLPAGGVFVSCLNADQDASITGVLAVSDDGQFRWIDQLYIAPAYVNQGLGSRLLQHALTMLARPVRLYTFQQNQHARRFYERYGFQAIALTDGAANEEKCPDVLYELS